MAETVPDRAATLLTSEPLVAHLATVHDDRPHVAPLWYNYRDGVIEITTTGRKLENLRQNPHVALSVQKAENGEPRWGLTLQGTARVIEDEEAGKAILHRINRRYGADEDAWSENTPVEITVESIDHWEY